ncbi:embryonic flower 1 [Artemisia annua]|uniref:Embryonic flower 1 n=1 Tax=Artemisia annua TaxID=35608 RepID=A0A2U1LZF2_ARTAN|nr:embryonic flower 1 [Artemisia annua]
MGDYKLLGKDTSFWDIGEKEKTIGFWLLVMGFSGDSRSNYFSSAANLDILNMNGNDERGLDPMDTDRLIGGRHAQGSNVASVPNTSHSTFKIDSLSIKLGIVKEKGDAQKCRHFSIR